MSTLVGHRPATVEPATASDETRALVGAWGISGALGVLWVLLVLFGPRAEPPTLLGESDRAEVAVTLVDEPPPPPAEPEPEPAPQPEPVRAAVVPPPVAAPPRPTRAAPPPRPAAAPRPVVDAAGAFGGAFAAADAGPPAADVRGVLRGVRVSGAGAATTPGSKATLDAPADAGPRTPGRGRLGTGGDASIGAVTDQGGVARAAVRVSTPRATGSTAGTAGPGDGAQLGTVVRSRESQLRFCYVESGLRVDPALAGSLTLAVTIEPSGAVTAAGVAQRSWSGEGASAAETCILQKVRGWRFPARGGGGSYEFSFSFTR